MGKVLEAAGSSQLDPGAFVKLSSGAARNKAVSDAWDTNALLTVQVRARSCTWRDEHAVLCSCVLLHSEHPCHR